MLAGLGHNGGPRLLLPGDNIIWAPQAGPQQRLVRCPVFEVMFGGARGGGKCLPLDEPVLTPFGWRAMGEIGIGSQVCNPDGSISRVIDIHRPGTAKVWKLTFSDGSSIRCDDNHIWKGAFVGGKIKRAISHKLWRFSEIRRRYETNKDSRFLIPLTEPAAFTRPHRTIRGDMRPIDPYLLGVLLGDGSLTQYSVRYATTDPQIDDYMAQFGTVRVDDGPNRRLVGCRQLISDLRRIGVWGARAENKSVPDAYLWADEQSRWAILQGLMDTDGTADSRGQCYFSSASRALSEGVQHLAWSLGFKATLTEKQTQGLPAHCVYIRGSRRADLFRLERKRLRAAQSQQEHHSVRRLVSIEPAGEVEVGCFQVDNPNGLFVAKDFIVTHNTDGMLGDWLIHSDTHGENANGLMVRRTMEALTETIERAKELFIPLGAKYLTQSRTFKFPNGARIKFRYLERDEDAQGYQGHSYCVGIGTPVLMADRSWKTIENIRVGESVMTMQGARKVLGTVKPYMAPCVEATIRHENKAIARQIHPIWHPLAAIAELPLSPSDVQPRTASQSSISEHGRQRQPSISRLYADPKTPDWLAWSANGQSDCIAFADELRAPRRPQVRSFRARLHAPSFHSALARANSCDAASEYQGFRAKAVAASSRLSQALPLVFQACWQWLERALSGQGIAGLSFANARACAARETPQAQGFPAGYPFGSDCGDVLAPTFPGTGQDGIPSQGDAENTPHARQADVSDTIPAHSRQAQRSMGHPYTGEVLHLSEEDAEAQVDLVPYGYSMVADLQVEGNNHYITFGGFVNKNTRVYVEELTQFPKADPVLKLLATLRSAKGVPCAFRATANPGGPGHLWVKRRYIDPYPAGNAIIREWEPRSKMWMERIFIPSKVQDNRLLTVNDPFYIARLAQSGSANLVKAWLDGDWSVIDGAYFDCWSSDRMVVKPHPIPKRWTRYRSFDWGSASPFSCGWWALSDGLPAEIPDMPPDQWPVYPKGALIRYREWYGADGDNKGIKLQNQEIGRGIKERSRGEKIAMTLCDPSIFKEDGGPSIAEQMYKGGKFMMQKADNSRIPGWGQMRARMLGNTIGDDANKPMIYCFDTCVDSIRTIPALQHDDLNPEDLDTDGEDHAADDWRYMCASRPFQRKLAPGPGQVAYGHVPTLAEVIAYEQRNSRSSGNRRI